MNLQYNATTNKSYKGTNQAILLSEKDINNYKSDAWLTFVQARSNNLRLVNAKGKGIHLRTFINDIDEKGNDITKPIHFTVFNHDLTEPLKVG